MGSKTYDPIGRLPADQEAAVRDRYKVVSQWQSAEIGTALLERIPDK